MSPKTLKQVILSVCIMGVILYSFPVSAATDRTSEVSTFITMLESSLPKTRIDAAKQITRSGLTDPVLFDLIQEKLLKEYSLYPGNSTHIDEMAWMCKALASSGNDKYRDSLRRVSQTADSDKLKRYAQQSIDQIPIHAQRNQVMTDEKNQDPTLSPQVNQYISMLKSNDPVLKRDAAKSICRNQFTEEALFDVISDELLKDYPITSANNSHHTDALAWMCKALGSSGMQKYRPTLAEILEKSSSEKLKRHAGQSLGMLK